MALPPNLVFNEMNNNNSIYNLTAEIQANFQAQQSNNKARIRELHRYATAGFAHVFNQVPILLNVNDPDQPGYVADSATPCGVKFVDRQEWLPPSERKGARGTGRGAQPVVESLFLIGSSGSVGHNLSSDLDYWVCHEAGAFSPHELDLFQRKLAGLSDWARDEYATEANFYIVNLEDLLQGRLTRLDKAETEGEVAPKLLLEELYRTFLYVAGRAPVWQGLPVSIDPYKYQVVSQALTSDPAAEYVDLGFPSLPSPQEILAAALWLARKSEADPFKGILKIVALLDYVESDFTRELLCDQVKEAVFTASPEALPVDPYIMTIDRVVRYGEVRLTPEQLELLRIAAALKVIGEGGQAIFTLPENSTKRRILSQWTRQWGWGRDRSIHLTNYNRWPEREKLNLGGELLNMLSSVYIRIAQHLLRHYPGQVNPQDEELAPLAARLLARMGGLDSTVETLPSKIHRNSLPRQLVLRHQADEQAWNLHALAELNGISADNLIYSHHRAARAAAWLVHNRIYGPDMRLDIRSETRDAAYIDPSAMDRLLALLDEVFPPFNLRHNNLDTLWSPGGHGHILVALNFETPPAFEPLISADFVLRTGWGEMRHYYVDVGAQSSIVDKYLKIIQSILKASGSRPKPENLVFQTPDSLEMRKTIMNIRGGLAAAVKRGRTGDDKKSRIDI